MTSPLYAYSADRLIRLAYTDAGKLAEGASPSGEKFAMALGRLNDLVMFWTTQGVKLFLLQLVNVPLVAGKAKYTFSPTGDVVMEKPLEVLQGFYLTPSLQQQQLIPLSWDDYLRLPQTSQQGAINSYFVDKKSAVLSVAFWLVPNTTAALGTVQLLMRMKAALFAGVTDQMAFPIEWFIALRWALAMELSTGQPEAIQARCEKMATYYKTELENWDVENTPTQMTPDSRTGGYSSRFA